MRSSPMEGKRKETGVKLESAMQEENDHFNLLPDDTPVAMRHGDHGQLAAGLQ